MKYIISESKLDNILFKYLDLNLKGLGKRKYYNGVIFAYPDEEYGVLGYKKDGTLHIYYMLIDEISSNFGIDKSDSKSIIGRWFSDKYQLEVINTLPRLSGFNIELSMIDTN